MTDEKKQTRHTGQGELADDSRGAPTDERLPDGQYKDHWILPEEERVKGFVRPVRRSYVHVGPVGPENPLRDLTEEEVERHRGMAYMKYEAYPDEKETVKIGRFWTQEQLDCVTSGGCEIWTLMPMPIAETYARDPGFYGSTFCGGCLEYLPVGTKGEFVWEDGSRVGT